MRRNLSTRDLSADNDNPFELRAKPTPSSHAALLVSLVLVGAVLAAAAIGLLLFDARPWLSGVVGLALVILAGWTSKAGNGG